MSKLLLRFQGSKYNGIFCVSYVHKPFRGHCVVLNALHLAVFTDFSHLLGSNVVQLKFPFPSFESMRDGYRQSACLCVWEWQSKAGRKGGRELDYLR